MKKNYSYETCHNPKRLKKPIEPDSSPGGFSKYGSLKGGESVKNVDIKIEALRLATLIMCQSTTAEKGKAIPTPSIVLEGGKRLYAWLIEQENHENWR